MGLVSASSGTVRGYEQQAALEHFSHRIASLSLSGFIFFGSSTSLATKIQEVGLGTDMFGPSQSLEQRNTPRNINESQHVSASHI